MNVGADRARTRRRRPRPRRRIHRGRAWTKPSRSFRHRSTERKQLDGAVVVDKPAGMTSHDVVDAVRKRLGTSKVGHSGTLDPDATGLLVLGIGKGTRFLSLSQARPKRYRAVARFGITTTTQDASGRDPRAKARGDRRSRRGRGARGIRRRDRCRSPRWCRRSRSAASGSTRRPAVERKSNGRRAA